MNKRYKRLVLYACSFGKSGAVDPPGSWNDIDCFGHLIAKHYGLEFENRSIPGWNNDGIFWNALNDISCNDISDSDLLMIQWTYVGRARHDDKLSVMPHEIDNDEHVKWYYTHMYHYEMRATDVAIRSLALANLKPDIVFGFAEGLNSVNTGIQTNIRKRLLSETNFIAFNSKPLPHDIPLDMIYPCFHFKPHGHQYIAEKYLEKLEEINFENNYF